VVVEDDDWVRSLFEEGVVTPVDVDDHRSLDRVLFEMEELEELRVTGMVEYNKQEIYRVYSKTKKTKVYQHMVVALSMRCTGHRISGHEQASEWTSILLITGPCLTLAATAATRTRVASGLSLSSTHASRLLFIMSLPVISVDVRYDEEKGDSCELGVDLSMLTHSLDKIKGFLENYKGEKDVAIGMEDMHLEENQEPSRYRHLKYMNQLVS
jgi:hypothetical protein